MQERPALWNAVLEPEDNDDGLEHFVDAPEEPDEAAGEGAKSGAAATAGSSAPVAARQALPTGSGAPAGSRAADGAPSTSGRGAPTQGGYDMHKRCVAA